MHGADLKIDRFRRLIIFAPDFTEHESEQNGEHHSKLKKNNRADVVMAASEFGTDEFVAKNGCKARDEDRNRE